MSTDFAPKPTVTTTGTTVAGQRLVTSASPVQFAAFNANTDTVIVDIQGGDMYVTFDGVTPSATNGAQLYAGNSYSWHVATAQRASFVQITAPGTVQAYEFESILGSTQQPDMNILKPRGVSWTGSGLFASIVVTGTSTLQGAVTMGSTLGVTGAVTLSSTLTVSGSGAVNLGSGTTTVGGNLAVTGTSTLTGNVGINGNPLGTVSLSIFGGGSTVPSGTGNSYGTYIYNDGSGVGHYDVISNLTGATQFMLRTYNNGTYYALLLSDSTGNLTAPQNLTVSGTLNGMSFPNGTNSTGTLGYINVPQNSQSAAYTAVLTDQGKHIYHPSADTTARTYTIPANSSVAYPIGTALTFVNDTSAGTVTITITTDTLVLAGAGTTGSRTLAANGIATALKVASTRWIISGTNLT